MNKSLLTFSLIGQFAFITGCAGDKRIIFVTNTQFGARVGTDSRQTPEIVVGYNRQEAALVPLYLGAEPTEDTPFNSESISLLSQAKKLTAEAKDANYTNANWTGEGKLKLKTITELLQQVIDATPENKEKKVKISLPLKNTIALSTRLSGSSTAPERSDYATLIATIDAELDRPIMSAKFDAEAKALGKYNSTTGERVDALSVIGTFRGSGTGKSGTSGTGQTEASGSIAQYFATGMAAQILAEKAGAAAVSSSPNAQTAEAVSKYEKKWGTNKEKIIAYVTTPQGTLDKAKLTLIAKDTIYKDSVAEKLEQLNITSFKALLDGEWWDRVDDFAGNIPAQ